ncbi:MAG: hypothetical protein JW939_06260 [Candidatus Thermoplasmatota archaeon]|nr:hypothetical protein [Candidatus Thermoplasmatota archaeon]
MLSGSGTIELVSTAKMVIVGSVLIGASFMDVRYRRIPDRFWMLMLLGAGPLTFWEMALRGGIDSPVTFLSLLLPLSGVLFIFYGYPELKEALKGSSDDILFFLIYAGAMTGGAAAFAFGDRELFAPIGISFIFMVIYFVLYSVPIGGTRLIHGGADAKCLISLAALFPWYILDLPYQIGPFYDTLDHIPSMGAIFPFHLSVFFNAAVLTGFLLVVIIPVKNILKGEFSLSSFTSYRLDIDDIQGKHVWIVLEEEGRRKKEEPLPVLIGKLRERGEKRVLVTPKIPFILSLAAGMFVQVFFGNIVAALFLALQ